MTDTSLLPQSMVAPPSMALLTPPLSGKGEMADSFSSARYDDHDMPLFGPLQQSGRYSPSDVAMMKGRMIEETHGGYKRRRTSMHSSQDIAHDYGRVQPVAHQAPRHSTIPSPQHQIPKALPPLRKTIAHIQDSRTVKTKSAFSAEEINLLVDFTDRFPRTFEIEAPFLRIRTDQRGGSWLDVPEDLHMSISVQPTSSRPNTHAARGHKRKDSGLGDCSPMKKNALLSVRKQRQATPKARAVTPREVHGSAHSRKRSTLSETHSMKGDNRPTRQAANKPKVSTDYLDWPDFTPGPETLDNEHARSIAARFDIGLIPKQDVKQDPLTNELHEVEVEIIRKACIDTGKYLFAKRSVFVGYLKHLLHEEGKRALTQLEIKQGLKSWNKTAAQNAGHIDVNKISKLFQLFWSQVGWFDREHFEQYLNNHEQLVFPEFDHTDGRLLVEGGFQG